jgi:acyl-CoA synthetase (NDP forming)
MSLSKEKDLHLPLPFLPFSCYRKRSQIFNTFLRVRAWKQAVEQMKQLVDLKPFFEPRGAAIVGASRTPGFGYGIPITLIQKGWADRLYLVNASGGRLHGMPVFKSIFDVPDPVDLAVVILPAPAVPDVLARIGKRGIKHVIIESAGFAEVGDGGRLLQKQATGIAAAHGLRIIGPNCLGVINNANGFSTVETLEESRVPGSTAIIAQSGAFGNVLMDSLPQRGLFISKAITLGNRMGIDECDALEYLRSDLPTRAIMMYLEGAADGTGLRKSLGRVTREKPVIILKSGRTVAGSSATASHTGSMSGDDQLYEALFAQTGAIRAASIDELIDLARAFSTQSLPKGNCLGIVTTSGSVGALTTDVAVTSGLAVPALSRSTVKRLKADAPSWMNVRNPLDVGPSGLFAKALSALLEDPHIDMVLAIPLLPFLAVRMYQELGFELEEWFGNIASVRMAVPEKPLIACAFGHREFLDVMARICGPSVPLFNSPEHAVSAFAALWRYSSWKNNRP